MIRKATNSDICGIAEIYQGIFEKEKSGVSTTGWIEGVYPTRQTAVEAMGENLFTTIIRWQSNWGAWHFEWIRTRKICRREECIDAWVFKR